MTESIGGPDASSRVSEVTRRPSSLTEPETEKGKNPIPFAIVFFLLPIVFFTLLEYLRLRG